MKLKRNRLLVGVLAVVFLISAGLIQAKERTAYLGVYAQSVDEDIAEAFDLGADYGAVINEVIDDSPADNAGLRNGDVIIKFDGRKVWEYDDLLDFLEDSEPGDKVALTIAREDKNMEFEVTLAENEGWDDDFFGWRKYNSPRVNVKVPKVPRVPNAPNAPNVVVWSDRNYIGVSLNDLNDQLGSYFGVEDGQGALITEVSEDTPAEKAGLKAGDVIVEVNDKPVDGYRDIKRQISKKDPGETIAVKVLRDKQEMTFNVEIAEHESSSYGYHYNYNGPDIDLRSLDIQIPKLKGFIHSLYDDEVMQYFDSEEFENDMKDFAREMEQMKKELKETKRFEKEDIKKEIEQLKKELQELRIKVDD